MTTELKAIYEKALATKAKIEAKIEPLRATEAEIMAKIEPLEAELRKTRRAIAKAEVDNDLAGASRTLAALAPAQKKLRAEPGGMGAAGE